jgi:hypothetical protein
MADWWSGGHRVASADIGCVSTYPYPTLPAIGWEMDGTPRFIFFASLL